MIDINLLSIVENKIVIAPKDIEDRDILIILIW